MKKPNNYENTQASGEFTPVELGGHYLTIKDVAEMKSKSGKDMIRVSFDFASNDKQPGYFMESFKNDIRPEKKWPNQAIQYILTEDSEGNCSRSFKTFITCVEHSNKMQVQWGENFGQQFKNKVIGGVFGPQLDYYENKERKKKSSSLVCVCGQGEGCSGARYSGNSGIQKLQEWISPKCNISRRWIYECSRWY